MDREVLERALDWNRAGRRVGLVTVLQTWGSAPRPAGAMLALRDDGLVVGSVSGGCVEDDLIERVRREGHPASPAFVTYGVTQDEAARFGLPCGGTLRLVHEPVTGAEWLAELLRRVDAHEQVARELDLDTGEVRLRPATGREAPTLEGRTLTTVFGPRWRLLLIGAGQLSRAVASMAGALDFRAYVCDPRDEYSTTLDPALATWLPGMPDDVVVEFAADARTAIVALTHDPKLDDLALMEALRTPAFYVGALGSRANDAKRRARLACLGLDESQIARLHGPVGLHIGSRTPAEIAVSILAELVAVRNGVPVVQRKPGSGSPRAVAAGARGSR